MTTLNVDISNLTNLKDLSLNVTSIHDLAEPDSVGQLAALVSNFPRLEQLRIQRSHQLSRWFTFSYDTTLPLHVRKLFANMRSGPELVHWVRVLLSTDSTLDEIRSVIESPLFRVETLIENVENGSPLFAAFRASHIAVVDLFLEVLCKNAEHVRAQVQKDKARYHHALFNHVVVMPSLRHYLKLAEIGLDPIYPLDRSQLHSESGCLKPLLALSKDQFQLRPECSKIASAFSTIMENADFFSLAFSVLASFHHPGPCEARFQE
jgi:hypothetical protein